MAEIVNLRRERKRRARVEAEREAADNRVKFGAPKSERELAAARRDLAERTLDGIRRDPEHGE